MFKRILTLGLIFASSAWALPSPLLVLDARNTGNLPKKFRVAEELHAAGSAQFSERGLLKAVEKMHGHKITIVDLREESHGYLNGNAVSLYAKHDAVNAGLTANQIEKRENAWLKDLGRKKFATVYNIIDKSPDGTITNAKPQDFAVHNIATEAEIAANHHFGYRRIYVQDFHAPSAKSVDEFVKFVVKLPDNRWLYFHCRGGSGRTTSFMAMYDMMRNAKTTSFDDIIARQVAIGGKDLATLPQENEYKYPAAEERLVFLKKFYEYAKSGDFSKNWSDWNS